jgi:glycosyltransferase involved in cell wall biosynthesis
MDVGPSGPLGRVLNLYKRRVLGPILRSADYVVALSADQRDLVVQRYGVRPDHVAVVPNGVGEEFFVNERKPPPVSGPLRVLFVGRLAEQKKLDRLFAALRALERPYHLDIVGDGELRELVAAEASRTSVGSVVLWGSLSREELRTRYREADVFVLTSEREGMPVALLEAMAARLPVVANNVQGLREFVSGVGMLGDATDPPAFACLLRRLADEPWTWRRMSDASAAFAQGSRWPVLVPQLEDVYTHAWEHRYGPPRTSSTDLSQRMSASLTQGRLKRKVSNRAIELLRHALREGHNKRRSTKCGSRSPSVPVLECEQLPDE